MSKTGFRGASSLLGPFWLHLSVAFCEKGFSLLCRRWQEFGPCTLCEAVWVNLFLMDPPVEWIRSIYFFSPQGWQSTWNMVAVILPNISLLYFLLDAIISSTVNWELIEGHSRRPPTYTYFCFLFAKIDALHYMLGKAVCEFLSSRCMSNRVPCWTDCCADTDTSRKPPFGDRVFPFCSSNSRYLK